MRDRAATRALVLGLLAMWFGVFAPFAIFSAVRSLRRIHASDGALSGTASATAALVTGMIGLAVLVVGVVSWWITS